MIASQKRTKGCCSSSGNPQLQNYNCWKQDGQPKFVFFFTFFRHTKNPTLHLTSINIHIIKMGLSDFFSSFMPTVYADEEPQVEETVEEVVEETPAAEEEVEEEEEEEEEPEDPKPAIWEGN